MMSFLTLLRDSKKVRKGTSYFKVKWSGGEPLLELGIGYPQEDSGLSGLRSTEVSEADKLRIADHSTGGKRRPWIPRSSSKRAPTDLTDVITRDIQHMTEEG